ncbi:hypothetical protein GWE18_38895 [Bradyrhizobium sp. CSA112]|uniref:hypothetical protein n=1 Tax=Bradyrhizobium sp. CSA112 TaxID=2699170 RepID=UPI0023AE6BAE|nr:hypothetical protein [Bradyrhizobium sp. CSA112]MDE5458637.1 hypothetical protein [Bradyrhizobium sp. CSA112]
MKLTLSEIHPGCVAVQCEADRDVYQSLRPGQPLSDPLPIKEVIWFDATKSTIIIRPIITYPSERCFEAKYDRIEEIVLEGFDVELPEDENAVHEALFHLPAGFIKNIDAGLGFPKEYRSIVDSIEEIDGVKSLVITKRGSTRLDDACFYLAYRDFEKLRLSLSRITRGYQREGRIDRAIQAHNALLTTLDPQRFPEKRRPLKKDTISNLLVGRDHSKSELSKADRAGMVTAKYSMERWGTFLQVSYKFD